MATKKNPAVKTASKIVKIAKAKKVEKNIDDVINRKLTELDKKHLASLEDAQNNK